MSVVSGETSFFTAVEEQKTGWDYVKCDECNAVLGNKQGSGTPRWCHQCNSVVCADCAIDKHRTHDMTKHAQANNVHAHKLAEVVKDAEQKTEHLRDYTTSIGERRHMAKQHYKHMQDQFSSSHQASQALLSQLTLNMEQLSSLVDLHLSKAVYLAMQPLRHNMQQLRQPATNCANSLDQQTQRALNKLQDIHARFINPPKHDNDNSDDENEE